MEKHDQTDEGYVEQRFEEPCFMKDWTVDQKAEFVYQLLLCMPVSKTIELVEKLSPLLHRDFISALPYEIAVQILYYLDINSLAQMTRVSKRWKTQSEDQTLWKSLFYASGWKANQTSIDRYLSEGNLSLTPQTTMSAMIPSSSGTSKYADIPIHRTNIAINTPYEPLSRLPMTRLKPFKRSTNLLLDRMILGNDQPISPTRSDFSVLVDKPDLHQSSVVEADNTHQEEIMPSASMTTSISSSSSSSNSSNDSLSDQTTHNFHPFNLNDGLQTGASLVIRPTQVYPSRSQPLQTRRSPSSIRNHREVLSHMIVERPFLNRPPPRRHVKYDESAIFHYKEQTDTRYINWKRLYRNRTMIERRWTEGKYRSRQFPSAHYLSDLILIEQSQHSSGIYCLQFNAELLITGSRDKNLKIWDIRTGRLKHTLEGHIGSVLCLQFDSHHLISGSSDGTLILWDIQTGQKLKTFVGHGESVLNVKLLGNKIVSCSKDRTVRTWDLKKGTTIKVFRGHRAAVNAVQFKGDRIVSASGDRTIKIWDMNTGECLKTLDSHSRGIACVEYDGEYIVSGSSDQSIKVWNATTGECIHTLLGHTDLVRTLQLDSKTKTIVSGSYDGSLKIWGLEDGKLQRTLNQSSHGRILNLQFDFSKIVCCSNIGKIIMYDFTHGMDMQFLL